MFERMNEEITVVQRESGFYKLENDELFYAQNEVMSSEYYLIKEQKDNYEYPVFGWSYFESENDARAFFELELIPVKEETIVSE